MKIVISGATGLIGHQLVKKIIEKYNSPKILILGLEKSNFNYRNLEYFKIDLLNSDFKGFKEYLKNFKPDLFFHLAWNTNHFDYLTSDDNFKWEMSSKMLIDIFYENGGKKFIGLGSSIEYDWNFPSPLTESLTPISKKYPYSAAKLNVLNYLIKKEKKFIWGRVFFVFGPNQDLNRLMPKIISNALSGKPNLTITNDLERDYISTFEIANQIIMLEKSNCNGVFNICSGKGIKLIDFVKMVSEITNKKIMIENNNYSGPLVTKTIFGSNSKFKNFINDYEYSVDALKKDLELTINSYKL